MAITIIVTNAGRAALVNAVNTGTNAVTITQLGITEAVFAPTAAQVALPGEIKRIPLASGVVVADDQIHVTASDVTAEAYAMRGFALYLNDGTLFAIYGQAGAILNKTAQSMMLLAADIAFADIDAELIEFGDTNFILPPATTEILGLVELATTAEGQTGADASRVLTPLTGKQSVLGWLLSQDGSGSGLDADMLDGLHASAFALAGHTHGTMAAQNANNVNITGGALNGVTLGTVNGNSANPAIFFTADTDSGIYRPGNDVLGLVTGGVERLRVGADGAVTVGVTGGARLEVTGSVKAGGGNTTTGLTGFALPYNAGYGGVFGSLRSSGDVAIGRYVQPSSTTANAWVSSVDSGAARSAFTMGNTSFSFLFAPTQTTPIGEAVAMTEAARISDAQFLASSGSGAAPGISFLVDSDTGLYRGGPDTFGFATAGVARAYFSNDGRFLPSQTGTYDMGSNGARWRNVNATGLDIDSPAGTPLAILNASASANDDDRALQFRIGGTLFGTVTIPSGSGGAMAFAVGNGTVTERLRIAVGGTVLPGSGSTQDFGASSVPWKSGYFSSAVSIGGNEAWHAGNDGSGSGLDADLLDGQQGSYYLPAASYTAADVRTKLLTVDGAGTGIDADLLDGQHGSYYLPAATFSGAQVLSRLLTVDGSGSGIDADLLDGYHASSFDRIVEQNLTDQGGYIVYASGRKECWGSVYILQDSYATWNLPVNHTSWCHPTFTYTGKVGTNNTGDNTMFAGFIGAPPSALRFWNAEDIGLTIYVRTIGV